MLGIGFGGLRPLTLQEQEAERAVMRRQQLVEDLKVVAPHVFDKPVAENPELDAQNAGKLRSPKPSTASGASGTDSSAARRSMNPFAVAGACPSPQVAARMTNRSARG